MMQKQMKETKIKEKCGDQTMSKGMDRTEN